MEQHPLLETILFSGAILLIPEMWLLRPVLSIFGFGPSGPVEGRDKVIADMISVSLALPRYNRGLGAVPFLGRRSSWFARLQSAGMMFPRPPPGTGRKIVGSIGVGLGIAGSLFKGCG